MNQQNIYSGTTGEKATRTGPTEFAQNTGNGGMRTKELDNSGSSYNLESPSTKGQFSGGSAIETFENGRRKHHVEDSRPFENATPLKAAQFPSDVARKPTREPTCGMQIPPCMQVDSHTIHLLKTAMKHPPVTVATLGELNLTWMMHYVNLRCDINFDHDLHFTPIKGPRGEEKRRGAIDYWLALAAEFRIYQHNPTTCQARGKITQSAPENFEPRLPIMFKDLKELLETLVPDRDHDQVTTNLDVDLLMQEVRNGVLDIGKLSRWLATLLKSHCAPMRDESAEAMADQIERGANTGDLATLIKGLESLFGFLEAMKLDVANHQIRTFRYLLIEETIPFQQSYFRKRIEDGRLGVSASQEWYRTTMRSHRAMCDFQTLKDDSFYLGSFLHGLVWLCASPAEDQKPMVAPVTLHYDHGRLQQLRADVQDIVYLRICVEVFNQLLERIGCKHQISDFVLSTLRCRILTIADNGSGQIGAESWMEHVDHVALEVTRAAYAVYHQPRLGHKTADYHIPEDEFALMSRHLKSRFQNSYAPLEAELLCTLEQETVRHAMVFQKMNTLAMSESQKHYQQNRQNKGSLEFQSLPDKENIARMLAHVGVLHWQVWAELVYLQEDERMDGDKEEGWRGGDCMGEEVLVRVEDGGRDADFDSDMIDDNCDPKVVLKGRDALLD